MGAARAALAALALVALLSLSAGCGDSGESDAGGTEAEGVGIVRAGSTAQFANCRDWREGSEEDRYATIEDIRGQLTPQSAETAESDLSDDAAYELFEHSCAEEFASTLRLYKLYARAQAFAPLTTDAAE
jgi:hypothetical protein